MGMTREDLMQSLGTIARSGTAKFAEVGSLSGYAAVHAHGVSGAIECPGAMDGSTRQESICRSHKALFCDCFNTTHEGAEQAESLLHLHCAALLKVDNVQTTDAGCFCLWDGPRP